MSLSPIAFEALRAAQSAFSEAEADVFEDALARGLEALDREGRLVGAFAAFELARLESLVNAQPAMLSEAQVEALAAAGNGAVNDYEHDRQCGCSEYPDGCATDPQYRRSVGYWDTGAFEIAMSAVIGLWESMRADTAAEELGRLRARVDEVERTYKFDTAELRRKLDAAVARIAELLTERHSTNEALSEAAEALREKQSRIAELERPAVERHRREVRESYRWLAAQAREDGDFEGETVVFQQLVEREQVWKQEDALAREFAADPLAVKPWTPGPSAEASADKLTRLLSPTQALRDDEPVELPPLVVVFRASHDSIVIERYTTAAEARKHCEALLRREEPDAELAWTEEEDDVQSLTFTVNGEFQDWSGYVVTRLEIASRFDPDGDE